MTRYLREQAWPGPLITVDPAPDLGMVVVIPAHDEPDLLDSLRALESCEPASQSAEVIVVANASAAASVEVVRRNRAMAEAARGWASREASPGLCFHVVEAHDLHPKHAGVGLARKIGMDEACRRLESTGRPDGVVACFDADSRCDGNYLVELERLFGSRDDVQACSVYFEHPLEGSNHPEAVYEAIAAYELHLRYYVNAQRWAGFPFAFQTIGSSMAVRCEAYQAQGGMNRRQAGEDFYFLHKFTPLGQVKGLTSTRVIPSPRVSDRVPFGTGKAVGDHLRQRGPFLTYAPQGFKDLRCLFARVDELFALDSSKIPDFLGSLPASAGRFAEENGFCERVSEIQRNTTSIPGFRKRFFRWWNAFLVMKYLHFARDAFYPDEPVQEGAGWLGGELGIGDERDARRMLRAFRRWDRSSG